MTNEIGSNRSPSLRRYLTHYYLMNLAGTSVAIGEAGDVQSTAAQEWRAHVGVWLANQLTGKIDVGVFGEVRRKSVSGPLFSLVPKNEFQGRFVDNF